MKGRRKELTYFLYGIPSPLFGMRLNPRDDFLKEHLPL
jgi:hypothetical protein